MLVRGNLALITIDSLRSDSLGYQGNPTTPPLEMLLGRTFVNIVKQRHRRFLQRPGRAVLRVLSRNYLNASHAASVKLAGLRSQRYLVPTRRSSPSTSGPFRSCRRTRSTASPRCPARCLNHTLFRILIAPGTGTKAIHPRRLGAGPQIHYPLKSRNSR
jgi:hypothetical protein